MSQELKTILDSTNTKIDLLNEKADNLKNATAQIITSLQSSTETLTSAIISSKEETGGTILSTEDLFMHLCHALPEKPRILLAGLEEGVWQDFPQKTKLIGKIHASEIDNERFIGGSASTDVTGGMYEKVRIMKELVRKDQALSVSIFSGERTGNITKELKNIPTGTSIVL